MILSLEKSLRLKRPKLPSSLCQAPAAGGGIKVLHVIRDFAEGEDQEEAGMMSQHHPLMQLWARPTLFCSI